MAKVLASVRIAAAGAALVFTACSEPTGPTDLSPAPGGQSKTLTTRCQVDVRAQTLKCDDVHASITSLGELRPDIIIGKQDVFVRLSSTGTSYDAGTEIFQSNVNIENLLRQMIGTSDGVTTQGIKIFFNSGPTVTSGSGSVTVYNADGTGTFTGGGQPYFLYSQMLDPYQISDYRNWQFSVPSTVSTFEFTLLVSTPVADETASLIDRLWTGSTSTSWSDASNWQGGVPVDTSTVAVPPASMITSGNQPVLSSDVTIRHFRVGSGSTLDLGGFTLTVSGNVDAPGTITNGTVSMTGSGTYLGGNIAATKISGATKLQRDTKATGAIVINDGSLTMSDKTLSISLQ